MRKYYLIVTESYFDSQKAHTQIKHYVDCFQEFWEVALTIPVLLNLCIDCWYRHSLVSWTNVKLYNNKTKYTIDINVRLTCAFLDCETIENFISKIDNEHNKNCIDVMTSESWESQNTGA